MKDTETILKQTPSGQLHFTRTDEGLTLTLYEGKDMLLDLAEYFETKQEQIIAIGPKAFFNARLLQSVILPSSVRQIGDWAFSHCPKLKKITMTEGPCQLGRSLFEEDRKLRRILLVPSQGEPESEEEKKDIRGYGGLLAACATIMDAPYLLTTEREDDALWLSRWDQRLMSILARDDMEGYTEVVLCGEEDYGGSESNLEEFVQRQRWRKVRLCFLRLLYDKKLADANKIKLQEYLLSHTKGCESEETWLFLVRERGEDPEYWQLFTDLGCVTEQNFDDCITSLPEGLVQMRAFLLRWQSEHLAKADALDKLQLDW
ncbi:MAG: leucine-rich repeat domain-containing protein [Lachnospiraceae bacterium]|nr:leucine-rich repeat domain-containing protein [Lachnospiraceae bacterium]